MSTSLPTSPTQADDVSRSTGPDATGPIASMQGSTKDNTKSQAASAGPLGGSFGGSSGGMAGTSSPSVAGSTNTPQSGVGTSHGDSSSSSSNTSKNNSHDTIDSASAKSGQEVLDRVVRGAHDTVDRLAETVAPHVQRLSQGIGHAGDSVHSRAGEMREMGDEWTHSLRSTVRENPVAAVVAALALGMLLARLTS